MAPGIGRPVSVFVSRASSRAVSVNWTSSDVASANSTEVSAGSGVAVAVGVGVGVGVGSGTVMARTAARASTRPWPTIGSHPGE